MAREMAVIDRAWMVLRCGALACVVALAGCDDAAPAATPAPVRAIKYMTLEAGLENQRRRISGVVEAGTTSVVAFQTGGQVIEILKNVGDAVEAGDLLARLDPEPLRLRLASAQSEAVKARAAVTDGESKHSQQKQLFEKGYATRTNFESALASLRGARGDLGVAQSQLDIAKRDLAKSELRAPFSGVIAKRSTDAFEEVSAGQSIFTLQTEGEYEVRVSLPETLINVVSLGDATGVLIPLARETMFPGVVSEISPLSEGVNAYPVTIKLLETVDQLRPGMSAEALFEFPTPGGSEGFTVPIAALKPLVGEEGGELFVFNEGKLAVRKVRVVNVRDNALQIVGDIAAGDVIATAGVSLLYDGMPARLLDPASLR